MNRAKGAIVDSSVGIQEITKWTEDMDERFLSAMIDESRIGNKVYRSWTTHAYHNMVHHLHQSGFGGVSKNNLKNRPKVLKERWCNVLTYFLH